jgi:hypothetical protein
MTTVGDAVAMDEAAARDVAVSFNPMIGTSSSQPQKAAALGPANSDNDVMGECKIFLGHPSLIALGNVSLNCTMDTANWRLPKRSRCSVMSRGVSTTSATVFCYGPPCSRSRQPLKRKGGGEEGAS